MPSPEKFARWIDLIAALLIRNHPATFDELADEVPEYFKKREEIASAEESRRRTLEESLKRTFERDKQELKTFGVPIESLLDEDGNPGGAYRLKRASFYLPYLCVALPNERAPEVQKVDRYGYQALTTMRFDPDQLTAIVESAGLVRSLGDPLIASDAVSALRKLAVDLPIDAASSSVEGARAAHVMLPRTQPSSATFESLSDALHRRKQVAFEYHTLSSDRHATRTVEPYGLFFLSGHWYLVGRDTELEEIRNFRLSRIANVAVNTGRSLSPDFAVPPTFRLREHATSRQAWELGDDDIRVITVEIVGDSVDALAARGLGSAVDDFPLRRQFTARRINAFIRWALSLGGDMRILEPTDVREQFLREASATRALYERAAPAFSENEIQRPLPPTPAANSIEWQPKGAAAQLRRILHVVPQLADGEDHLISEVAEAVGSDTTTVLRDLESLVNRYDVPGGFNDGVRLYIESDRVSAVSNHLLRPMRLTAHELCALELGLVMLRQQRPPSEHGVLERTREQLRRIIVQMPGERLHEAAIHASIGAPRNFEVLKVIRDGITSQHEVHIGYRKSGSHGVEQRDIQPYAILATNGLLYIVAHCAREEGVRKFRLDRVQSAAPTTVAFERPPDFEMESMFANGRVFQGEAAESLVIRYSAKISRWIAEREGVALSADGTLVMSYPLADSAWAVRFVLQYAADAEVLAPESVRGLLRERLGAMG